MLVCRAPTYPPKTGPTKKCIAFLRIFFSLSLILLTNLSSKSLKAVFQLKKDYRDCYYMYSCIIYRPLKVMVRSGHKIMLNF